MLPRCPTLATGDVSMSRLRRKGPRLPNSSCLTLHGSLSIREMRNDHRSTQLVRAAHASPCAAQGDRRARPAQLPPTFAPLPFRTVRCILQRTGLRVHSSSPWRDRDAERPDSGPFWQDARDIGVAKGTAAVADRLWLMCHDRRLAALADHSNDQAKPACPPWRQLHCRRLAQPGARQQQPIHGLSWSCTRLANPPWEALNNGR